MSETATQSRVRELPDDYERIDHHDIFDVHCPERGVVITVHERDRVRQRMTGEYPYKVIAAQNQDTLYEGVFDSESHAEDKVLELAQRY